MIRSRRLYHICKIETIDSDRRLVLCSAAELELSLCEVKLIVYRLFGSSWHERVTRECHSRSYTQQKCATTEAAASEQKDEIISSIGEEPALYVCTILPPLSIKRDNVAEWLRRCPAISSRHHRHCVRTRRFESCRCRLFFAFCPSYYSFAREKHIALIIALSCCCGCTVSALVDRAALVR